MSFCKVPFLLVALLGQTLYSQTYDINRSTGSPLASYSASTIDSVNLDSGNLRVSIPLLKLPGRGIDSDVYLTYNSKVWKTDQYEDEWGFHYTHTLLDPDNNMFPSVGWGVGHPLTYFTSAVWRRYDNVAPPNTGFTENFTIVLRDGTRIPMVSDTGVMHGTQTATGFWSTNGTYVRCTLSPFVCRQKNGSVLGGKDTNGNQLAYTSGDMGYTDTLGRQISIVQSGLTYYDSGGVARTITFTYQSYTVKLEAGDYFSTYYNQLLLTKITYPDNQKYEFEYHLNGDGSTTAELAKLKLPTGGYIRYVYAGDEGQLRTVTNRFVSSDGTQGTEQQWTYTISTGTTSCPLLPNGSQGIAVDPFGTREEKTYPSATLTRTTFKTGSTTLKVIEETTGSDSTTYSDPLAHTCANNPRILSTKTTLSDTNLQSQVSMNYTTHGNVSLKDETNWGTGAPGSLLRRTTYSYLHNANSAYSATGVHILDRVTSETISNGSTTLAHTTFGYDEYSLLSPATAPGHDPSYGPSYLYRGNRTRVSRWRNTDSAWLATTSTYDALGNVRSITDPQNHTKTLTYNDNWGPSIAACAASGTYAYLTLVTNALGHQTDAKYYPCTGFTHWLRDQNDINNGRQGTVFDFDSMNRPKTVSVPSPINPYSNVINQEFIYHSATISEAKTRIDTANGVDPVKWTDTWTQVDGLGRHLQTAVAVPAPDNWIVSATCHDALGRVSKKTYPVYSPGGFNSSPCGNLVGDTFTYDALSRPLTTTHPDSNFSSNTYSGNQVTSADQTNRQRRTKTDALGRLIEVMEPHESSGLLIYETAYWYDALDNLTGVDQRGNDGNSANWRSRRFTYNSLSQLLTAQNPESGIITYAYNNDGTVLSKTDARGITTTYNYDALHRLRSKAFSNGDPSQYFDFDSSQGIPSSNSIGRLVVHWSNSPTVQTSYSYDAMGRPTLKKDWTPPNWSGPHVTEATYNLDGSMAWLKYPSTREVTFGYDIAARPNNVSMSEFNNTAASYNYWNVPPSVGGNPGFHPTGAVRYADFANTIRETVNLNPRLQPSQFVVAGPAQYSNKLYNYCCDAFNANNGNILSIEDHTSGTYNEARTQFFEYDWLNRIKRASEGYFTNLNIGRWGQSYTIDAWGNLTQIQLTKGSASTLSVSVNANNRFNGYGYDAAGNMTMDLGHTYIWDAESRLKGIDSYATSYTYDANGMRVRKQTGTNSTDYVYFGSEVIAEKNQSGDWSDYIFAGGKRVARADNYTDRIVTDGTRCSGCGFQFDYFQIPDVSNYKNYVIRPGDKISVRQWQVSGINAGLLVWFTDGTNSDSPAVIDQYGHTMPYSGINNNWAIRTFNLSSFAGKTINYIELMHYGGGITGYWAVVYDDLVLYSTDGMVKPIYTDQTSMSFTVGGSAGSTRTAQVQHVSSIGTWAVDTTQYYHGDHLGSTRLMTAGGGWPVSSGTFLPFGEEFGTISSNHYKFTGKERDSESGFDYFGARYYGSIMGRWLSPDWSLDPEPVPFADYDDPQTINLYSYVRNSPIQLADKDGHCPSGADVCFMPQLAQNKAYMEGYRRGATAGSLTLGITGGVAGATRYGPLLWAAGYNYLSSPSGQNLMRNGVEALAPPGSNINVGRAAANFGFRSFEQAGSLVGGQLTNGASLSANFAQRGNTLQIGISILKGGLNSGLGTTLGKLESGAINAARGEGLAQATITAKNVTNTDLIKVLLKSGYKEIMKDGKGTGDYVKTVSVQP